MLKDPGETCATPTTQTGTGTAFVTAPARTGTTAAASTRFPAPDNTTLAGGAGGMLYVASQFLPAGTLTVTVGAGGSGGASGTTSNGTSGYAFCIGNLVAIGGGQGNSQAVRGGGGGSGGGGYTTGGIAMIAGQGNAGGGGNGGGGGGAGGAGSSGGGGAGLANSITGTSVTYAAGGGYGASA